MHAYELYLVYKVLEEVKVCNTSVIFNEEVSRSEQIQFNASVIFPSVYKIEVVIKLSSGAESIKNVYVSSEIPIQVKSVYFLNKKITIIEMSFKNDKHCSHLLIAESQDEVQNVENVSKGMYKVVFKDKKVQIVQSEYGDLENYRIITMNKDNDNIEYEINNKGSDGFYDVNYETSTKLRYDDLINPQLKDNIISQFVPTNR